MKNIVYLLVMLTASISAQQGLYAAEIGSGGDRLPQETGACHVQTRYMGFARKTKGTGAANCYDGGWDGKNVVGKITRISGPKEYEDLVNAVMRNEPGGVSYKKRHKQTKVLLPTKSKKHRSEINDPANKNKKKDKKASNNPLTQYAVTQAAVAAERNSSHQADIMTLEKEQKQAKDVIETNTERIVWLSNKVSDLSLTSKIGIAVAFGTVLGVGAYSAYNGYKTNELKKK